MSSTKLPAIHFYVGDWKKDVGLQSCSIAARGLWFEMLLMMVPAWPNRKWFAIPCLQVERGCAFCSWSQR